MRTYKYYSNVEKNADFTEEPCQFCGTKEDCLEGIYFGQSDITSVCLSCLDKKKIEVDIPDYLQNRIKNNASSKIETLKYTPPIPWVQFNDWQVCCDDYMKYIGEWEQEDFINEAVDGDGINLLKHLLNEDTLSRVDDINVLWEDIGYDTVAYVFQCPNCGRITVVCQSY